MPELLLELFSEEIPARMQARAAEDLARLATEALAPLTPSAVQAFHGPRRIALTAQLAAEIPATSTVERGPRATAPQQALTGFLRKHGATPDRLAQEAGYWVLHKSAPAQPAASLVAATLPSLLRRFPWPKSMRWGGSGSLFTWVRPLRRILCVLDGAAVPFTLADGADDGHGLAAGVLAEGHRFFDPAPFPAHSAAAWRDGLRARRVVVDADERRRLIASGLARLAAERGAAIVDDPGLLDEVAGLVEWPVPLLGRIDAAYMDLPPEVMQVSMRVNQRYFALRQPGGAAAPLFGFAANIEAADGGATDDRRQRARAPRAILGRPALLGPRPPHPPGRPRRRPRHRDLPRPARHPGRAGAPGHAARRAHRPAGRRRRPPGRPRRLARQGRPHHRHGGRVPRACRASWAATTPCTTASTRPWPPPSGTTTRQRAPVTPVPTAPVTLAVALADKLDLLAGFFAASASAPPAPGTRMPCAAPPSASSGMVRENGLRLPLAALIHRAGQGLPARKRRPPARCMAFIDRAPARPDCGPRAPRHDVLDAAFAAQQDDDLVRVLTRVRATRPAAEPARMAPASWPPTAAPPTSCASKTRRTAPIAARRPRPLDRSPPNASSWDHPRNDRANPAAAPRARGLRRRHGAALSQLRAPIDAYFTEVTVNAADPTLRRNRLLLLSQVKATMDSVADFSRIEG